MAEYVDIEKKIAVVSSDMESLGLKSKKFLKRQDAVDCEETSVDDNPLVFKVVDHFQKIQRPDLDQSVFDYIREFCMERTTHPFLAADKLTPEELHVEAVNTIAQLTEILGTDGVCDIRKVVKDIQARKENQGPEDDTEAADPKGEKE